MTARPKKILPFADSPWPVTSRRLRTGKHLVSLSEKLESGRRTFLLPGGLTIRILGVPTCSPRHLNARVHKKQSGWTVVISKE